MVIYKILYKNTNNTNILLIISYCYYNLQLFLESQMKILIFYGNIIFKWLNLSYINIDIIP